MIDDPILVNDWHAVATSKEAYEGRVIGVRLLEENVALWRSNGEVHAFKDRCPHRGTRLSLGEVRENVLVCPYHGWQYNGEGSCVYQPAHPDIKPPAKAVVEHYHVKEKYGLVWVCLGEPEKDIPDIVGIDDDYHMIITGPYDVNTSAPRAVENFLDMAHFPFVHTDILGEEPHTAIKDYDVEITDEGVVATNCKVWQPKSSSEMKSGAEVAYTYRVLRPYTAMLSKDPAAGEKPTELIFLTAVPKEELNIRIWVIMATTYGTDATEQLVHDFQDKIFNQDRAVLESQRPQRLPLDVTVEFHQRCDRTSISYRKWLKEIGLNYGTTLFNE